MPGRGRAPEWKLEIEVTLGRGHPLRPLELLCGCISAGHQGRPLDGACAAALLDPSADLVRLARLAGGHLVTPMLAACIAESELRARLPEDFALYLEFIHAENARRNRALRRQLGQVAACLNRIGIEPVLLKGANRLVDGLYRDPGWRFMRDLDLLVARDRLSDAVACLESIGYGPIPDARLPEDHRHVPALARDGETAVVEIHADLLQQHQQFCPAEQVLARSRPVLLEEARVRVPETADQLAHLVGHDHLHGDLPRSGTFLLRSLFETALLCRDERSVPEFIARATAAGLARCAQARLELAARLFPGCVSPALRADLGGRVQAGALVALEHFDESGRIRCLVWFGRLLLRILLNLPAEDAHRRARLLSPDYYRGGAELLRCLWTNH